MGAILAIAAVKRRYERADFAAPGEEEDALLMALIGLPLAQRQVWHARFCGVRRELVGEEWVYVPTGRLSASATARMLDASEETVRDMTHRAAVRILGNLGRDR